METKNHDSIRRTDLQLRTIFFGLTTEIYEIEPSSFVIFCNTYIQPFEEIKLVFDNSIKAVSETVELATERPSCFIRKVEGFGLEESFSFKGEWFNSQLFLSLLVAKFPKIFFNRIESKEDRIIIIVSRFREAINSFSTKLNFLNFRDKKKLESFLMSLKLNIQFNIVEEESEARPNISGYSPLNPIITIAPSNYPNYKPILFEERDEALWFDNIEQIVTGTFSRDNLKFYERGRSSCYFNYSLFENIDIRNGLLMFDKIYITPPYDKTLSEWLLSLNITRDQFVELIARKRIYILFTQPASRHKDHDFWLDIFKVYPDSIVSRRGLAALLQADIVEIADNYLLKDLAVDPKFYELITAMSAITNLDSNAFYEQMIWPIKAKYRSFKYIFDGGYMRVPAFGVNTVLERFVSGDRKNEIDFEFSTAASSIHLANALDAVYFPFYSQDGYTNEPFSFLMGEQLNFYRNATQKNFSSFLRIKEEVQNGIRKRLSPVDIFEINQYVSVTELDSVVRSSGGFRHGKRLFDTLAPLSPEARNNKIKSYNANIEKLIKKKRAKKMTYDLGFDVASEVVGTQIPFVGLAFNIIKKAFSGKESVSTVIGGFKDRYQERLFTMDPDRANVEFLTEINRVAKLKHL